MMTEALLNKLIQSKSRAELEQNLAHCSFSREKGALAKYIEAIIQQKQLKKAVVIEKASLDRTYGYQILNGDKQPSRDKIIQICVGNQFSLKETNAALQIGNYSALYAKEKRDSIVIFSLTNHLTLQACDEILYDTGLDTLVSSH